jgi:hypothetical protein
MAFIANPPNLRKEWDGLAFDSHANGEGIAKAKPRKRQLEQVSCAILSSSPLRLTQGSKA